MSEKRGGGILPLLQDAAGTPDGSPWGLTLGRRLKVKPSEAKSPILLTQLLTSGVVSFRPPGCLIDQMLSGMQRGLCSFHV